eukprot:CAMPEP_0178678192 /NCGR_PEP_ID=MMETSP0698-20121128/36834_1 /TAXON_ID=265572 /ORGANISM="Extubocellulus spinifer, Strain CCMP396" /LENGTH=79 /DNA_ID=CAMNT_0020322513 /DNA_START=1544 /DNA_END=1780 /DNA_ORIENTATION=+
MFLNNESKRKTNESKSIARTNLGDPIEICGSISIRSKRQSGGSVEDGQDSGGETVSLPETALLQKGGGAGTGLPDAEEQ